MIKLDGWNHVDKSAHPPREEGVGEGWSYAVCVITNLGTVCPLSYYHGKDGGCWQRPSYFKDGEQVVWWCCFPSEDSSKYYFYPNET